VFVRERFGRAQLLQFDTLAIERNIEHTRFPVPKDETHANNRHRHCGSLGSVSSGAASNVAARSERAGAVRFAGADQDQTLSERLDRSDGVIRPRNVDRDARDAASKRRQDAGRAATPDEPIIVRVQIAVTRRAGIIRLLMAYLIFGLIVVLLFDA
jgi:hypothetical protein